MLSSVFTWSFFRLDMQKQEGAGGTVTPPFGGGCCKGQRGCVDLMIDFNLHKISYSFQQ